MANILLAPENFAAAQWAELGSAAAVVGNEYTAPDGTATADKLVDDGGGGQGFVGISQAGITLSLNTVHTLSLFVYPDGNNWIFMEAVAFGTANKLAYFDVANDAVGTTGAAVSDTKIESMPNGFKRIHMTFLSDAADGSGSVRFLLCEADGDQTVDRDGTSAMAIWGAYLNEGATAETYVSQAGITVTSSTPRLVRGVTRNITRDITKNLIDF